MDYEVGFQLIEKNQENTKAVGVFGFKIGNQWLYAPVFFLNGDLKGHELLYIKNQDLFVPLKEEWVNYLLGRRPSMLGEGVNRNLSTMGVMPPNLHQMSRSPNKFASDASHDTVKIAEWLDPFMPDLAYFATADPLTDSKYAKMKGLPDLLKEGGLASFRDVITKLAHYPAIIHGIDRMYGPDMLTAIAREHNTPKRMRLKIANDSDSVTDDLSVNAVDTVPTQNIQNPPETVQIIKKKPVVKKAASKVKVTTMDEVNAPGGNDLIHDLDAKEREKLVSERVVVKDDRDDKDITLAFNTTSPMKLKNPDRTNIYEVLVKPDKFSRCLVLFGPYTNTGARIFCTVVELDSKRWVNIHPSRVWISNEADDEAFREWCDRLPEAKSFGETSRETRMILMPQGQGTCPFTIHDKNDDVYETSFRDSANLGQPLHQSSYPRQWAAMDAGPWHGSRIRLTGYPGKKIKVTDGEMSIPAGAKYLSLMKPNEPDEDKDKPSTPCCGYGSDPEPLQLGNMLEVMQSLMGQMTPLKIYSDGRNVTFDEAKKLTKTSALKQLIVGYGMREKTARSLLDLAEESVRKNGKPLDLLLKAADGQMGGDMISGAPNAPPFPEPNMGWDPMTSGNVPTMNRSEFNVPVTDMSANNTDRSIYNPTAPDPRSMSVASNAAQTGQREVFDTTMMGSLLKSVRDDSLVDRYMGDLMKGMDRKGRILFLFYWRGDEFERRYGKQDMPELEDGLRNSFEADGDIVLALKRKSVDPFPDDGTSADLDSIANQ